MVDYMDFVFFLYCDFCVYIYRDDFLCGRVGRSVVVGFFEFLSEVCNGIIIGLSYDFRLSYINGLLNDVLSLNNGC